MSALWGRGLALAFLAAAATCPAHAATPIADDLAHCAAIAAPETRLACYDILAHRAAEGTAAPARAPLASSPAASPPPASAPTASPAATPAPIVEDPKNFGLSPAQQHVENVQVKSEAAQVVSISRGGTGQAVVVLDNGQSWQLLDDDGWVSTGNKVTIKRAALGSFLMHTPSNHTYRVHRLS
jgi:hypothetical protein